MLRRDGERRLVLIPPPRLAEHFALSFYWEIYRIKAEEE